MFSYANLPGFFKQGITEKGEEEAKEFLDLAAAESIPIDFPITPQDLIELHRIYEPYTFKRTRSTGFSLPRDHLIPSIGMDIAENILAKYTNADTLSIGTRFNRLKDFKHNCFKLDGRDEARIRKHLNRHHDKDLHDFVLNGTHPNACSAGVQNCSFQSTNFVMNNVYDISLKEICKAFRLHNFSIGYAVMILPDALTYNVTDHHSDYGYTIKKMNNGEVEMSFGTGALSYVHNYKIWREWCIKTGYESGGINIQIERINSIGPMTVLQITRLTRGSSIRASYYPKIPKIKIYDYSKHAFWLSLRARLPFSAPAKIKKYLEEYAPSFIIPQILYDSIVKQGIVRPDENFTRQNLALHLKATTSRIVINSEVLQGGVYLTAGQFSALLITAYIDSAVMRQEQTRTIGSILKILKGERTIERYIRAFISGCKGVLPTAKVLASNAAETLAYGLQARELLAEDSTKLSKRTKKTIQPRVRTEEWFAYTEDGNCINDTKSYIRSGNRAYSKYYDDNNDFSNAEHLDYRIEKGHMQPLLTPDKFCDHDVGYTQSIPFDPTHLEVPVNLKKYHRYETAPNTDNETTTMNKIQKFLDNILPMSSIIKKLGLGVMSRWHKKRVALLCGGPGGDFVDGIGAVNITSYSPEITSVKAGVCARRIYEGLNICCLECLKQVQESILYCDLGLNGEAHQLASTQYTALLNLLSLGKPFGLKLQSFMRSLCIGEPLAFLILELIKKHNLGMYNVGNANEIFVQNITPSKPILTLEYLPELLDLQMKIRKIRKNKPFVLDRDGLPDLWQEGEVPSAPPMPPAFASAADDDAADVQEPSNDDVNQVDQGDDEEPQLTDDESTPEEITPGTVEDFRGAHCVSHMDAPLYAATRCNTTDDVIKTEDVPTDSIIRSDCQFDEELIADSVAAGKNIIRKRINFCQGCELSNMIHYKTYTTDGDEIIPGSRKDIPSIDFREVCVNVDVIQQQQLLKNLKKELRTKGKNEYDAVNEKALKHLDGIEPSTVLKLSGVVGCPGSGKTRFAMGAIPKDCVVITPYRRLTEEYQQYGYKSRTFVAGLDREYDCVLLDEVYAFSPGIFVAYLLKSKFVYAIGDPRQMSNVDEKKIYGGLTVADMIPWKSLPQLSVSYTLPIDSTYLLNKYFGYDISTVSTVLNSHKNKDWRLFTGEYNCFTTAHERNNSRAKTVAKIQGTRANTIQLLVEPHAKALIQDCPGQFVVAVSRHTKELLYSASEYGSRLLSDRPTPKHTCKPSGLDSFYYKGAQYDYNNTSFMETQAPERGLSFMAKMGKRGGLANIPEIIPAMQNTTGQTLIDAQIPTEIKVRTRLDNLSPELDSYVSAERGHSIDHVQTILNKVAPTLNQHEYFYGVTTNEFNVDGKLELNNIEALSNDRGVHVCRLPVPLYGRPTMITSASQSLHTMLRRYVKANYRKGLKYVHAETIAGDLFDTFMTRVVKKIERISEEDISMGFAEFVGKMVQRGRALPLNILDEDESRLYTSIEGFLKQQNKADLNIEAWIRYENGDFKAGQGIAAQCKNINVLAAAYVRAFEKNLRRSLQDNVFLVNGLSDRELATIVQQNYRPDAECVGIDIREFDTVHDKSTEFFMWKVYKAFGVPSFVYKTMGILNFDWILSYVLQDAEFPIRLKATVHDKMQSGRPDTLIKNSLVALVLVLKNVSGKITAIYSKGDDVNIQGYKIKMLHDEPCLKIDPQQPPAFVGYIIADKLTLDIPRLCVKLLNRNYASDAAIDDYILAVKDWLRVIRGDDGKMHASIVNSKRYSLSVSECEYLLGFMYEFAAGQILNRDNTKQLVKQRLYKFVIDKSETST